MSPSEALSILKAHYPILSLPLADGIVYFSIDETDRLSGLVAGLALGAGLKYREVSRLWNTIECINLIGVDYQI